MELREPLGGAAAGIRLTLSEWLRYATLELVLYFLKGRPAGRAVDQRTSQCAATLPVKLRRPGSVGLAMRRAFEIALPLLRGNPTPLSRLCRSCQFVRTYPLNYHFPNCSRPYQSLCHMSLGLKLTVMTSQTAPGRHLLPICQSKRAQRNKVLLTSRCTCACKFNKSRHREIHRNVF